MRRAGVEKYADEQIVGLFKQELDWSARQVQIDKFREFVKKRVFPTDKRKWPYSYHMWLVERVHEFARKKS